MSDRTAEMTRTAKVTEKPVEHIAYQVQGLDDAHVEAQSMARLPGVENAAVEYTPGGGKCIVVSFYAQDSGMETVRIGMPGWLVIRCGQEPAHPRDVGWIIDRSGRFRFYSDAEFRERYNELDGES